MRTSIAGCRLRTGRHADDQSRIGRAKANDVGCVCVCVGGWGGIGGQLAVDDVACKPFTSAHVVVDYRLSLCRTIMVKRHWHAHGVHQDEILDAEMLSTEPGGCY